MRAWARRLATLGTVTRFDYPYMLARKKRPDRLPVLVDAHRAALAKVRGDGPVVLAGKSMGSRVGCHLSLEEPGIAGLVCFGYPLVGVSGAVRDEVLRALRTPVLFVQGTRDVLCPLDHLERVRREMMARSELHVVETGDHSLEVTRTHMRETGRTQDDVDDEVLAAVAAFVVSVTAP
jgi:predicted alpha/beta-hydrolase family hydrolase